MGQNKLRKLRKGGTSGAALCSSLPGAELTISKARAERSSSWVAHRVRSTVWTVMHEEECEKLFSCYSTKLRVPPSLVWHQTPCQGSTILSVGFSHPTSESVYPIRFPKHGKSYERTKTTSYLRIYWTEGRKHWHDHVLPLFQYTDSALPANAWPGSTGSMWKGGKAEIQKFPVPLLFSYSPVSAEFSCSAVKHRVSLQPIPQVYSLAMLPIPFPSTLLLLTVAQERCLLLSSPGIPQAEHFLALLHSASSKQQCKLPSLQNT